MTTTSLALNLSFALSVFLSFLRLRLFLLLHPRPDISFLLLLPLPITASFLLPPPILDTLQSPSCPGSLCSLPPAFSNRFTPEKGATAEESTVKEKKIGASEAFLDHTLCFRCVFNVLLSFFIFFLISLPRLPPVYPPFFRFGLLEVYPLDCNDLTPPIRLMKTTARPLSRTRPSAYVCTSHLI